MNLVNVADYKIKGINYYWARKEMFNLTDEELRSVGVKDNYARVDQKLIPKLKEANEIFKTYGFEIIVKDGYRSRKEYRLVQQKRYEKDGKENTDKTFNTRRMAHASGLTVDINLIDLKTGQEIEMYDKSEWPDSIFINYYKNKKDPKSREFQRLQDLMISTMLSLGFKLGSKKEFWHFKYKP